MIPHRQAMTAARPKTIPTANKHRKTSQPNQWPPSTRQANLPLIGCPTMPFEWFRERESNFFIAVAQALANLFSL